jgi:hypothetical protein
MHIFKKSEKLLRGYLLLKSLNYEWREICNLMMVLFTKYC